MRSLWDCICPSYLRMCVRISCTMTKPVSIAIADATAHAGCSCSVVSADGFFKVLVSCTMLSEMDTLGFRGSLVGIGSVWVRHKLWGLTDQGRACDIALCKVSVHSSLCLYLLLKLAQMQHKEQTLARCWAAIKYSCHCCPWAVHLHTRIQQNANATAQLLPVQPLHFQLGIHIAERHMPQKLQQENHPCSLSVIFLFRFSFSFGSLSILFLLRFSFRTLSLSVLFVFRFFFSICLASSLDAGRRRGVPFSSFSEAVLSCGTFPLHSQVLLAQQAVSQLPRIRLMLPCQVIQLQPTQPGGIDSFDATNTQLLGICLMLPCQVIHLQPTQPEGTDSFDATNTQLVYGVQAGMDGPSPTADSPLQGKDAVCLPSTS